MAAVLIRLFMSCLEILIGSEIELKFVACYACSVGAEIWALSKKSGNDKCSRRVDLQDSRPKMTNSGDYAASLDKRTSNFIAIDPVSRSKSFPSFVYVYENIDWL